MTRETKLGLVVAGSFLALVGGVVAIRLKQVDPAGETELAQVQQPESAPAEPEKSHEPASAASQPVVKSDSTVPPAPDPTPAPPASPMNPPAPETTPTAAAPAPSPPTAPLMTPPTEPTTPTTNPVAASTTPAPDATSSAPIPNAGAAAPAKEPAAAPQVANPIAAPPSNPTPLNAPTASTEPTPPVPNAAPAPAMDTPLNPAPANTTVPTSDSTNVTPTPTSAPPSPIPEPPAPPSVPVTQPPTEQPKPVAETPKPLNETPPAPLNPNVANNTTPTVTVIPASSGTSTGAALDPPRGASATTPRDPFVAPVRPAAPPSPKRDSYLEEQYRWKPTDTFAAVSAQYYSSDKYAEALLKYNRDYPLASSAMRQNPPMMSPGHMIWIPPARILERDYGGDIRGLEPVVVPRSAQPQVEAVGPPSGLANSGFGNAAPQPYRVRDPGESLQEIARRTMGDSTHSLRIRSLNPTLSPDARLPIPAGTVLRLPAEARVDASDRP